MESQSAVVLERSTEERLSDTLSIQYNFDDTHLAVGCADGVVRVYASSTGRNIRNLNCRLSAEVASVTSLRWRPSQGKTQNVLFATTSNGWVSHWHATSGKVLDSFCLENTQVLCSDITASGSLFAVGCNDMTVKVFDENTKNIVNTFEPGRNYRLGHSSRIFAVKWKDQHTVISGGWDNNVIFWDLRSGEPIGSVFGPHVCGESIDFKENLLFTGSYDFKNQLQVWDMRNFQLVKSEDLVEEFKPLKIYSLQVKKASDRNVLVAGCSGYSQILAYNLDTLERIGEVKDLTGVYCLDFSQGSNKFVAVTTDQRINLYDILLQNKTE